MTKIERVYTSLMEGKSFNRFEAERLLHDHCLHTTVATIQQKYRITIKRIFETVRGYMGSPTRVCRYWIDLKERERIISNRLEQKANKKAAIPTHQDKESGLQPNSVNPTDEQGESQTLSKMGK